MTQLKSDERAHVCVPARHVSKSETISVGSRRSELWRHRVLSLFLCSVVCLLLPLGARAQTTATLTGTVQDPKGAVIPGAQVTLTNEATQEHRIVQDKRRWALCVPIPGTRHLLPDGGLKGI